MGARALSARRQLSKGADQLLEAVKATHAVVRNTGYASVATGTATALGALFGVSTAGLGFVPVVVAGATMGANPQGTATAVKAAGTFAGSMAKDAGTAFSAG